MTSKIDPSRLVTFTVLEREYLVVRNGKEETHFAADPASVPREAAVNVLPVPAGAVFTGRSKSLRITCLKKQVSAAR